MAIDPAPLHARYPFLSGARAAVQEAEVDLTDVVADDAVTERATERVRAALEDGSIGDPHRSDRVELLSYPVARVLVSLVDEHILVRRYAAAEAAAAHERFIADITDTTELRSVSRPRIDLDALLAEFELADRVWPTSGAPADDRPDEHDGYEVAVGAYLPLASGIRGDEWRLVNRALAHGRVPVTRRELTRLLRQAVHERVVAGLPLDVPDEVGAPLAAPVAELRGLLDDLDLTRDIDAVVPELFPPCMSHLLGRVQAGDHLEHHSRFAITSFLATIGLTTDEIIDLYLVNPGFGEDITRYQTDHIRGETSPTEYTPPACATMQSYGDCVNMDDLCDRISHPLGYYEAKLDDADGDELDDWRDRERDAASESKA